MKDFLKNCGIAAAMVFAISMLVGVGVGVAEIAMWIDDRVGMVGPGAAIVLVVAVGVIGGVITWARKGSA